MAVVDTPVISPAAGTYTSSVDVTISCATSGADIYYTTDGTDPTAGSTLYIGLFTLTESKTVKAIGINVGDTDSAIASSAFDVQVDTPVISPAAGTYTSSVDVTISCTTVGADIYYTTDGTDPTVGSTLYSGLFTLTESKTVKAIGIKTGDTDSTIASTAFDVRVETPVISPAAGTYVDTVGVTITCGTSGADIYYTTDGTDPTAGSTLYAGLFTLTETKTVKAIGIKAGDTDSLIASSVFTVVNTPTITVQPIAQTILEGATLSLSVTATGGTPGLTYQWRKNTTPITLATSSTYTKANAQIPDSGTYDVVVTNANGDTTSDPALCVVGNAGPVISGQSRFVNMAQNDPTTISMNDLIIVDPGTPPTTMNIVSGPDSDYDIVRLNATDFEVTVRTTQIKTISIDVTVSDFSLTSNVFPYQIRVTGKVGPGQVESRTTLGTGSLARTGSIVSAIFSINNP